MCDPRVEAAALAATYCAFVQSLPPPWPEKLTAELSQYVGDAKVGKMKDQLWQLFAFAGEKDIQRMLPSIGMVNLHGLNSRPDLNGQTGWIMGGRNEADRLPVRVPTGDATSEDVRVRLVNLRPAALSERNQKLADEEPGECMQAWTRTVKALSAGMPGLRVIDVRMDVRMGFSSHFQAFMKVFEQGKEAGQPVLITHSGAGMGYKYRGRGEDEMEAAAWIGVPSHDVIIYISEASGRTAMTGKGASAVAMMIAQAAGS